MALQNHAARSQLRTLQAELQSRAAATAQPGRDGSLKDIRNEPAMPEVVAAFLRPGVTRSAQNRKESQRITLPTTPAVVFLLLYTGPDGNSQYDVVLNDEAGTEVQRFNGLRPLATGDSVQAIPISIPSKLLKKGDYNILVRNGNGEPRPLNVFQFSVD
jgi:hypothetical protein